MNKLHSLLRRFYQDEGGATAVEYALMVALIALVVISAVTTLGTQSSAKFSAAASGIANGS